MDYPSGILVEAEAFNHYGGWIMDPKFDLEMGSPYLLAHGNGIPVEDATTDIIIPESGEYNVWVRAKDWALGHPGRFTLAIDGKSLGTVFGTNDKDWAWQIGERFSLKRALHDCASTILPDSVEDATQYSSPVTTKPHSKVQMIQHAHGDDIFVDCLISLLMQDILMLWC